MFFRLMFLALGLFAAQFGLRLYMTGDWNVIAHVSTAQRVAAGVFILAVIIGGMVELGWAGGNKDQGHGPQDYF
jgi:hypothetical protein